MGLELADRLVNDLAVLVSRKQAERGDDAAQQQIETLRHQLTQTDRDLAAEAATLEQREADLNAAEAALQEAEDRFFAGGGHITEQAEPLQQQVKTWRTVIKIQAQALQDLAASVLPLAMIQDLLMDGAAQGQREQAQQKAAIARVTASKPVRLAVEAGLFPADTTYFDYGCGHGADIEYIHRLGLTSSGWDPHFRPDIPHTAADVVNLGYVINVIEDTAERRESLINAWGLAQKVLIVAAQVLIDRTRGVIAYGDGIITSRNTFQKYYEQEELKAYIDQVLGVDAIPISLGIYFVFRDEAQAEAFRASRYCSHATAPRIRLKVSQFEEYRDRLQPLMDFYTDRGRLPSFEELEAQELTLLQETFGSIKRAFTVVLQATDVGEWDAIADKRRNDLLVYLALSHFGHRPKFKDLSPSVQADIKALFGSYQQACTAADLMLMPLGRTEMIEQRCRQSAIGQQRPNSLWVHVSALDQPDPLLRLYEGCASRTIGRP